MGPAGVRGQVSPQNVNMVACGLDRQIDAVISQSRFRTSNVDGRWQFQWPLDDLARRLSRLLCRRG